MSLALRAFNRGVKVTTSLQEKVSKVKRATRQGEQALDIALGELFVLASDVFVQRNQQKQRADRLEQRVRQLEEELQHYKGKT